MQLRSTGRVGFTMALSRQFPRPATVAIALGAVFACLAVSPANAGVFIGLGIPFYGPGFYGPGYYPGPYYYPPPAYYPPPPPVVYAPPQAYAPAHAGAGQMCYAGAYVCPMDRPVATGGGCYCLGNGGQHVWGRAN
jgi:hypothetical protein